MRTGRKRKAGARTKSGRLSRASADTFDRGTERAQAMHSLYGADKADAIGRAYRLGLLGEGSEAKALLDTGRKTAILYWRAYANGPYTCPLGDQTHGGATYLDHERIKRSEQWLNETMAIVRRMGPIVARSFEQLVIDPNPDSGPLWLDRLATPFATKADSDKLREALDGLAAIV